VRILIALICLTVALTATAQTNLRFLHEWRFEGHVAPFLVALDKGYYQAEGLNVTIDPGTGSLDSINRVATRAYDMSVADINSLMRYRDNPASAPVKAVMMVYDSPPFAILTLKKNNIRTPKDLEGKVLGAPAADGAWAQFPILAKVNNIDTAKVRVENVGFPVREALLAQGRVDAVTAFGSNALGVVAQGVPESEVVVMMMRRYGLGGPGGRYAMRPIVPPPAATPTTAFAPPPRRGPETILDERPLKVTMYIEAIRLIERARTKSAK